MTLENMSAHNFTANGFYWDGVEGFAGRYLTVWNVGLYGIYAISSRGGVMEESYVSGAADAAFYIGECNPCDADHPQRHGDPLRGRLLGHERRRQPRRRGFAWLREQLDRDPPELVRGRAGAAAAARRDLPAQRGRRQRHRRHAAARRRSAVTTGSASGSRAAENLVQDNEVRAAPATASPCSTVDRTSSWIPAAIASATGLGQRHRRPGARGRTGPGTASRATPRASSSRPIWRHPAPRTARAARRSWTSWSSRHRP